METKVCSKCFSEKSLLEYNVCSRVKDGRKAECRDCQKIVSKKYRIENKEKIKEYNTNWNRINQEYYKKYFEEYYTINYEKEKERKIKWFRDNKEYLNNYQKRRKKEDILFKITSNMRNSVNRYLKYRSKRTFDIIGCSPQSLKEHLETQFINGMSWDNRSEWHIDHIVPLSSAKTEEELYKLCHYSNLQPLWAGDNLSKGNKVFTN